MSLGATANSEVNVTRRSNGIALGVGLCIAAAVLVGFRIFWAQDACLDAGGTVRWAIRQCELAGGQIVPLFHTRSFHAWAHDVLVALLAASLGIAVVVRMSRGPQPRPSP